MLRLSHLVQHTPAHMLRRHFQLSADMVFDQLSQKFIRRICADIVKPDTGTHEYFFYPRKLTQLPQKIHIIPVTDLQVRTRFREQTLSVFAHALPAAASHRKAGGNWP